MNNKSLLPIALLSMLLLILAFSFTGTTAADGALSGTKICLDPGHGGSDPGAVNGDLWESVINLDVSFGLAHLLRGKGAQVVLTHTTNDADESWSNSDRYTFCNNEQATILISVHTNSVTYPDWDGSLTLYGPSKGPELAQALHQVMYEHLAAQSPPGVTFNDYGLDNFASGVLFKSDMPAAMVEPLFMSNPAEAALLAAPIFSDPVNEILHDGCADFSCRRGQIAEAVFLATLNYFAGNSSDIPPVVSISSPADGALFASGETITFSASAADVEDGDLTADLVWTSDPPAINDYGGSFDTTLADGQYTITATVTDSAGSSGSNTITITVGDMSLSVTAYKNRGSRYADLAWSGAASVNVDIFRDGGLVITTANDGAFTDGPLGKGGGTAVYQVCEAGTATCSNEAVASW